MPHARKAFTIVELLVSISVIFILITAVFVALRTARQAATRTDTSSTLRQMVMAYNSYSDDHKGRLMPGYVEQGLIGQNPDQMNLIAKLSTGFKLDEADTQSYVWRLAPYVGHRWETFMGDYRDANALNLLEQEFVSPNGDGLYGPDGVTTTIGIAEAPSFGLNSIYAGGDNFHGNLPAAYQPWIVQNGTLRENPNKIAAVRQSEVLNPAKLIIFGPLTQQNPPVTYSGINEPIGYCELRPPIIRLGGTDVVHWQFATSGPSEGQIEPGPGFGAIGGWLVDRTGGDKAPVANLDGSVTLEGFHLLAVDKTRWNPFLTSNN